MMLKYCLACFKDSKRHPKRRHQKVEVDSTPNVLCAAAAVIGLMLRGEANIFISFWPKQQMNDTWLCTLALAQQSVVADDFAQQQYPLPPTTRV